MPSLTLRTARTDIENAILSQLWLAYGRRAQAVADVAALRALRSEEALPDTLRFVTAKGFVYRWRPFSTAADDGDAFIKPTDVVSGQAGRWEKTTSTSQSGYLIRCELFNESEKNPEKLLEHLLGSTPAMVLSFQQGRHDPKSSTAPGALYKYTAEFTIMVISINERADGDGARQGNPIAGKSTLDPGSAAMVGDAKALLAGNSLGITDVMFVELGDERPVDIDWHERRVVEELDIFVGATLTNHNPDPDAVPIGRYGFNMQLQLAGTGSDAAWDKDNHVTAGMRVPTGGALATTIPSGTVVFAGSPLLVPGTPKTFGANRATYRDLKSDGTYLFVEADIDQPAPAVSYGALRVGVTITDGASIVADALVGDSLENFGPVNKVEAPAIVSIAISPTDPTIPDGTPIAFTATATYEDGSTADVTEIVTWASDDEAVATIDPSGIAQAIAAGTAQISASKDGVSASTTLLVT
jgi:phage gp37-like protein